MSGGEAPLRLGIAGCGRIVERGYLPAVAGLPGVEVVAVADPDSGRRADAADAAGAVPFADVGEMLDRGGAEALVVAAPAAIHEEIVRAASEAGLPSLIEKPPAPDLSGATAMAGLAPAPSIGFNRRFLQGAELAPLIPDEGWLELKLELCFRRRDWGAHSCEDEALLDAGIHMIDLASFLAGSQPIAVRDAATGTETAELELELGRGRARIRCATDRAYAERVEVRDRGGGMLARSRTDRLRAGARRLRGDGDPLVASLRRQLECFADRVGGREPGSLADAPAAVAAMSVVEACRRSAELGGAEVTVAGSPV